MPIKGAWSVPPSASAGEGQGQLSNSHDLMVSSLPPPQAARDRWWGRACLSRLLYPMKDEGRGQSRMFAGLDHPYLHALPSPPCQQYPFYCATQVRCKTHSPGCCRWGNQGQLSHSNSCDPRTSFPTFSRWWWGERRGMISSCLLFFFFFLFRMSQNCK